MNQPAYNAIKEAWRACVKVRALCPSASESEIGRVEYESPNWYKQRGATYFIRPRNPLTEEDLEELRMMTAFVNRSFIIVVAAILEDFNIVPYKSHPDHSIEGGRHVQLVIWLRNRFAHGEYEYNPEDSKHVETRQWLEELIPETKNLRGYGFPAAINIVLEPLKDGVLRYIQRRQS